MSDEARVEFFDDGEGKQSKVLFLPTPKNYKFNIFRCNQIILMIFRKTVKNNNGKDTVITLNLTDLQILNWFIDFKDTKKMVRFINEEDKLEYNWVNYQTVADEFPFLELNKQSVFRIFQKLSDFGILNHYHHKKGGSYSCYKLETKVWECIYYENNKTPEMIVENIRSLYQILNTPSIENDRPSIKNDRPPLSKMIDPLYQICTTIISFYYNYPSIIESLNLLSKDNNIFSSNKKLDNLNKSISSLNLVENSISLDSENLNESNNKHSENNISSNLKESINNHSENKVRVSEGFKNLIKIWNTSEKPASKHNPEKWTKTLELAQKLYNHLRRGSFASFCGLDAEYFKTNDLPVEWMRKKFSEEEIEKGIKNAVLQFLPGYYPYTLDDKRRFLPKTLELTFFNRYSVIKSTFLKVLAKPPVKYEENVTERKDNHPEITKEFIDRLFYDIEFDKKTKNDLIRRIDDLIDLQTEICMQKHIDPDNRVWYRHEFEIGKFTQNIGFLNEPYKFLNQFMHFLIQYEDENPKFIIAINSIQTGGWVWDKFQHWFESRNCVTLFPSNLSHSWVEFHRYCKEREMSIDDKYQIALEKRKTLKKA